MFPALARPVLLGLIPLLPACAGPLSSDVPASGTVAGPAGESLDAYLGTLAAAGRFTGSVLVARNGARLLSKGYGLADEQSRSPDTPATRYRIGSVTKQFTAAAILLLQERARLGVRDAVCSYVPDCPPAWQGITLHQLLTHSSGIPDYTNLPTFPALIGTPATEDELIARVKGLPLEFPPGTTWRYSNSGYILLGRVIAAASRQPYADFLQQNVFDVLGMNDTGYDANAPPPPRHATGYLSPGVRPVLLDTSEFDAAGALYSTVEDLFVWDEALASGRLLSREALEPAFTPQIPCPAVGCALATDVGYGYGWFVADQGQRYVYHWGRIDGFRSSNGFYPRDRLDVVVLSNLETTDVFGISTELGSRAASCCPGGLP